MGEVHPVLRAETDLRAALQETLPVVTLPKNLPKGPRLSSALEPENL